ncbi:MAG: A/G-specific adenine glycosylase [Flavobacteriaceae bacterium]|nr:A/G-specific adenine glycosylase [Flavobacteriaceae bacterium]
MNFTKTLLLWYDENKRTFLWRETKDPYKIWLSEVILQQTQTQQGLPYYVRFLETFPTIKDLALSSEDTVLKLWQGLGYYSRARNLHSTAQYIHKECGGVFPNTFKSLLKLKGVGDYTASAISSICFNIPEAVVDGNVYRFLSRYFGIYTPINNGQAHQEFKAKAMNLLDITQPGKFNQALMEFGSIKCKPRTPHCKSCPFSSDCIAYNQNKIHSLPQKRTKLKVIDRYFNYLVILDQNGQIQLEKRVGKGIWQNLFQFPLLETNKRVDSRRKLIEKFSTKMIAQLNTKKLKLWNREPIAHKLSHQKLFVFFWTIPSKRILKKGYSLKELKNQAVPVVIQNFLDKFFTIDT